MRVAISAFSEDVDGKVNPVFGRCPGYIIAEVEAGEIKSSVFVENSAAGAPSGAGIAAAQTVAEQGVEAVVSGNLGPNAFVLLNQNNIRFYQAPGITIKEAVKKLAEGTLKEVSAPTTQSKFGMGPGGGAGKGAGRGAGAGTGMGMGRGLGRGGAGRGRGPPQ